MERFLKKHPRLKLFWDKELLGGFMKDIFCIAGLAIVITGGIFQAKSIKEYFPFKESTMNILSGCTCCVGLIITLVSFLL